MALKKDIEYKGFTVSYWIITDIHWEKKSNKTFVTVKGYKDKPVRDEDLDNCIDELTKTYDLDGVRTIEQSYEALKTEYLNASYLGTDGSIPFENAEDC